VKLAFDHSTPPTAVQAGFRCHCRRRRVLIQFESTDSVLMSTDIESTDSSDVYGH
jgi:hypothetical protein